MQMIRTTITLEKEAHKRLKREALERDMSLNELLRSGVLSLLSSKDSKDKVGKTDKAFDVVKKLRKKINTKDINYRELIEHGRRY